MNQKLFLVLQQVCRLDIFLCLSRLIPLGSWLFSKRSAIRSPFDFEVCATNSLRQPTSYGAYKLTSKTSPNGAIINAPRQTGNGHPDRKYSLGAFEGMLGRPMMDGMGDGWGPSRFTSVHCERGKFYFMSIMTGIKLTLLKESSRIHFLLGYSVTLELRYIYR